MSFQSKGFWTSKDAGCLTDGDFTYDNASRIEAKRPHQWYIDGGEAELFPNKKQAVDVPSSNAFGGFPSASLSAWGNTSGFPSVPSQFSDRLFGTEASRGISFDDRNATSVNTRNLFMGRKLMDDDLFGNNSSFGLSISHPLEDPKTGINYGGLKKVKISEVRDSENLMPVSVGTSMGPSYIRDDNNVISTVHGYDKVDDSGVSMGLTYVREEDNVLTMPDPYVRDDDSFVSVGQSFNKVNANTVGMVNNYKADANTMPMENSFVNGESSILSIAENFKGDDNVISMGILGKGDDNVISMSQTFKGGDGSVPVSNNYNKGDNSTTSNTQSNNKGEMHSLSVGHSFDKVGSNIISFGSYNDDDGGNASGRLISSYDLLVSQHSVSESDSSNQKDLVVSDGRALINSAQVPVSVPDIATKKKEDHKSTKKTPSNNFPSNVRSLLSTGILDEVPVKYIAWSREKELRGVIKGSGYLCGCQSCNFSKVINAYEFERHAGCKTKHPNNHIYFDNGKTIYGIVQELRSTPQNMLFDVIQTITGSPINQKSFRVWKESFLAATRELQRIYGKDERNQSL